MDCWAAETGGTAVATSFAKNTSAQIVALADLFPDKLAAGREHFNEVNSGVGAQPIADKLLFHGPHAFEQLAASPDVDLIQISTPPFFHVQHLEAAVAAGKHVYCEKPVGIDVAQTRHALEIGKRVKPTQSVDVGFQCRNAPPIAAIAEKIKAGALGKIGTVHGSYNSSAAAEKPHPGAGADEYRLRNWLWDRALSGDILVEQNIHIIDLCNWFLGAHPVKAIATGGRSILTHAGDCWDHYEVDFTYPGDVHFAFSSTQFGEYEIFEAGLKLFGANGAATCPYSGPGADSRNAAVGLAGVAKHRSQLGEVRGQWSFQRQPGLRGSRQGAHVYRQHHDWAGAQSNCSRRGNRAELHAGARMLGRMAGYQKREVTWEDLLAHGETYKLGDEHRPVCVRV